MKNDFEIRKDVQEELDWLPQLDSTGIGVSVKAGIVTLNGFVKSYTEKQEAISSALRVAGVQGVADDLQVQLPGDHIKTDAELAAMVTKSLHWQTAVPDDRVKVKVSDGWVTLSGEVDWHFEREDARKAVEKLAGVRGVINAITLKPKVSSYDVKQKITSALQRNASLDARKINVDISGSKVVLSGMLPSFYEREEAVKAAWNAPGVTQVENKIFISEPLLLND